MDRVVSYKGFHIRPFEQASDCWLKSGGQPADGLSFVYGERREVLTTSAIRRTANHAIEFAIEAIDSGGMK